MDNYKIKQNPAPLTDEQINRHKDFSKLMANHQKLHQFKDARKPLYKNIGFMSMMVAIGIVLLMLVLDKTEDQKANEETKIVEKNSEVKTIPPAIDNEEQDKNATTNTTESSTPKTVETPKKESTKPVAYQMYKINPEKGAILYLANGSRLLVPSYAFFDEKGNVTKNEVTFYYKEYLSIEEAGLKTNNFTPNILFEIKAEESVSKTKTTLTQPLEFETITDAHAKKATVYKYSSQKENWESIGNERLAYRFFLQMNETDYPELSMLRGMIWELPEAAGKPSDFGYVFDRPWKTFLFLSKKEFQVKNTNTNYKSIINSASLLSTQKENTKLVDAFMTVYSTLKKDQNTDVYNQALSVVNNWKSSPEGKAHYEWLKEKSTQLHYSCDKQTSKIALQSLGFYSFSYSKNSKSSISNAKRNLILRKYPEKTLDLSNGETQW